MRRKFEYEKGSSVMRRKFYIRTGEFKTRKGKFYHGKETRL